MRNKHVGPIGDWIGPLQMNATDSAADFEKRHWSHEHAAGWS